MGMQDTRELVMGFCLWKNYKGNCVDFKHLRLFQLMRTAIVKCDDISKHQNKTRSVPFIIYSALNNGDWK